MKVRKQTGGNIENVCLCTEVKLFLIPASHYVDGRGRLIRMRITNAYVKY